MVEQEGLSMASYKKNLLSWTNGTKISSGGVGHRGGIGKGVKRPGEDFNMNIS